MEMKIKTGTKLTCPICNKEFTWSKYNRKYCSSECSSIAHAKAHNKASKKYKVKKKLEEAPKKAICPICNKEFIKEEGHQKYCSPECVITGTNIKKAINRNNKKEKLREYYKKKYHENKEKEKNKKVAIKKAICPICNKEFTITKEKRKYCSPECKLEGKRLSNKKYIKSEKYKIAKKKYYETKKNSNLESLS